MKIEITMNDRSEKLFNNVEGIIYDLGEKVLQIRYKETLGIIYLGEMKYEKIGFEEILAFRVT